MLHILWCRCNAVPWLRLFKAPGFDGGVDGIKGKLEGIEAVPTHDFEEDGAHPWCQGVAHPFAVGEKI